MLGVADDLARRQQEKGTGFERDRLSIFQLPGANLWTGEIDKYGERPVQLLCGNARSFDVLSLLLERAVSHVYADAICARSQQRFNHHLVARGWSKRRQNFGSSHNRMLLN